MKPIPYFGNYSLFTINYKHTPAPLFANKKYSIIVAMMDGHSIRCDVERTVTVE